MPFQEKRGGFVKNHSIPQIQGANLRKYSQKIFVSRGDFCIMIKMSLGVYCKTVTHTSVHLHMSAPPRPTVGTEDMFGTLWFKMLNT